MKTTTKLTLTTALIAVFASIAQAGDPSPRWHAELERQRKAERNRPVTTVAVYTRGGLGNHAMQAQPAETHLEFRTNAHGQTVAVYVPGRK